MKKIFILFALLIFPACFKEKPIVDKNIKVIIFDFDGTLANTLPLAIKCINSLAPEYGYNATNDPEIIEMLREKGMHEIVKMLGLWFWQLPVYATKAKNFFKENLKDITVFDGVKDMIKVLATKYEIAIITSNSKDTVKRVLDTAEIVDVKNIYADSSIFGKHAVIKRFLKNNKLEPCQVIYVGDEIRDVEACKKIGVKIVAVTWGYNSKNALTLSKPDYLADSCQDIVKIISMVVDAS